MGCGVSLINVLVDVSLPGEMAEEHNGRFFSTYRLGEKLGEGAFGQVRVCTHLDTEQEYAVKIMDVRRDGKDGRIDQEILRETRLEAYLFRQVQDRSHVVVLYESFLESPGLFYIVMERCRCSLMDRLGDMPKMSESEIVRIFSEMLKGIAAVHEVPIVHRDIKPDNYLWGGENSRTVKLADFGLAAKMPKRGLLSGVSGTVPYMSPEMIAEIGYDMKTDVWSFGATVYVILFGDCPYSPPEKTLAAVKKAILVGQPAPSFVRADSKVKKYGHPSKQAVEFNRYLLKRDTRERCTAKEALNHPIFKQDFTLRNPVVEIETANVRTITKNFKRKVDPTVQRHLDDVLKRLQAAGPAMPGRQRSKHGFTEAPAPVAAGHRGGQLKFATAMSTRRPEEARIVQSPHKHGRGRSNTHSGVITELMAEIGEEGEDELLDVKEPKAAKKQKDTRQAEMSNLVPLPNQPEPEPGDARPKRVNPALNRGRAGKVVRTASEGTLK